MVDLSKLTFLDSTGLRCIVTADERAREEGRRIVIVRGPDAVQRVFSITRLEERLEMVDDAAVDRLTRPITLRVWRPAKRVIIETGR